MLILEANFPFAEKLEHKKRPVLALTDPIGIHKMIICAFISSKIPTDLLESDSILSQDEANFSKTGLLFSSVVRLHKLASLETRSSISGIIGELPLKFEVEIHSKLKSMLIKLE
jgi:mRNA interferase MazF